MVNVFTRPCIAVYVSRMISDTPHLCEHLDGDLIGFLTAVNASGQPQTSPVWYIRDGEDIVVYNKPTAARLRSIAANEKVAFNLRTDRRGRSGATLEGTATVEAQLPKAKDFPGYVDKYGTEIERLGWTPQSFSDDYSVGLRVRISRVRTWGLKET